MFGKNHLSVIALAGVTSAVRVEREPLLSSGAPVREVFQIPYEKDHPMDYAVPDFGIAHETKYTLNNIKNAELKLKHKLNFFNDPVPPLADDHPMNYKVADFGQDPEITTSLNNMVAAESDLGHKFGVTKESVQENAPNWAAIQLDASLDREPLLSNNKSLEVFQSPTYSDHPVDYTVPDFGQDHEIRYTQNNIKLVEAQLKHNLNFMNDPVPPLEENHPMNYPVADFGVDEDVKYTQKNIGNAEQSLGQKMDADFGQNTRAYPINYTVPNFGVSDEILYTQNNIKNSEKQFGRKLNVNWDATGNDVNPRGYAVPNFGLDADIKTSLSNLDLEQNIHGRWNLPGFPEPVAEKADSEAKASIPLISVVEKQQQDLEDSAIQADKDVQAIPTTENTSETTEEKVASPPVSASDLTDAIDQAPINANDLNKSINNGKKAKSKTKFTAQEKAERSQKNDDADEEDVVLAKKLIEQSNQRKAEKKQKKAEAAAAAANAKKVVNKNEVAGASSEAVTGGLMFVQMNDPKDSTAPINQSLVKPQNWDRVSHTWFAQEPKDITAPVNQSLVKPQNWDKVAHTWF